MIRKLPSLRRATGESPSPALPHRVGKGDLFSYIVVMRRFSPSTVLFNSPWRGREAEGRKGEDSGVESPTPALPHLAVKNHRGKGDFFAYIIV